MKMVETLRIKSHFSDHPMVTLYFVVKAAVRTSRGRRAVRKRLSLCYHPRCCPAAEGLSGWNVAFVCVVTCVPSPRRCRSWSLRSLEASCPWCWNGRHGGRRRHPCWAWRALWPVNEHAIEVTILRGIYFFLFLNTRFHFMTKLHVEPAHLNLMKGGNSFKLSQPQLRRWAKVWIQQ